MKWDTITWIFLHSFVQKVNEEYFLKNKNVLFNIITYICQNLPCPKCKKHATEYLSQHNIRSCNNRQDLIDYMWRFHNKVSVGLQKEVFSYDSLEVYKRANFHNVCSLFFVKFAENFVYTATMDSWLRKDVTKNLKKYFNHFWHQYV
tara:strand:+ start:1073 stop:1513 length:441 start_codon:yes stop_codon:yes gene_type:complete